MYLPAKVLKKNLKALHFYIYFLRKLLFIDLDLVSLSAKNQKHLFQ